MSRARWAALCVIIGGSIAAVALTTRTQPVGATRPVGLVRAPGSMQPPDPATPGEAQAKGPSIRLDIAELDWGRVVDDMPMPELVLPFTNVGDEPLIIKNTKADCGCIQPQMPEKTDYAPGESGRIVVKYNLAGKRDRPKAYRVHVFTNDRRTPDASVPTKIFVDPLVRVDPPSTLVFGSVKAGATLSRSFTVTGLGSDFKVTRATGSAVDGMRVEVSEGEDAQVNGAAARRYQINITIPAPDAPGPFGGIITIRTNQPKRNPLAVAVRGAVMGDLVVEPEILYLGPARAGQPLKATFVVRSLSDRAFTIRGVERADEVYDPDEATKGPNRLTYGTKPLTPGTKSAYTVDVTVHQDPKPGRFRGALIVDTGGDSDDRLEVLFDAQIDE